MTTEYLLNREVEHILAALMPQNRLIMQVVLHTGLRISDVLALRTDQLALTFWVKEGKTGKSARVGLPAPMLAAVRAQAGPEWAFPGVKPGKPKTRQAVWHDVKRAAKAFRFEQNIGTHSFRKVYAVRLMQRFGDVKKVQRALRHSSPTVTAIYAMADQQLVLRQLQRKKKRARRRSSKAETI